MKVPVIDLEKLAEDIRAWGVDAELTYDEHEEAYVIHVGEAISYGKYKGKPEVTVAPGFKYRHEGSPERILAYTAQLYVHLTENTPVNSALYSRIVATSRISYHLKNHTELVTLAGIYTSVA